MKRALGLLSVGLLLVACGGDDEGGAADATTTTTSAPAETTTTAPRTPEEAFLAELGDADVEFREGFSPDTALQAAQGLCSQADLAERGAALSEDLASDPNTSDLAADIGNVSEMYDGGWPALYLMRTDYGEETASIILALTAEHLCPQHFNQ